jgi:hypothetical protein
MSCGTCSEKTKAAVALAIGSPVATGAARATQHCPNCGGFMPKSGACLNPRCRQLAAQSTADAIKLGGGITNGVSTKPFASRKKTAPAPAAPVLGMASSGMGGLDAYIAGESARGGPIPDEIAGRWRDRMEPNGWHRMGEAGAEAYLKKYGKGIGSPKVKMLARQAEKEGYRAVARGFWTRAYELEGGSPLPTPSSSAPVGPPLPGVGRLTPTPASVPDFGETSASSVEPLSRVVERSAERFKPSPGSNPTTF